MTLINLIRVMYAVRRSCSDFTDILRRLIVVLLLLLFFAQWYKMQRNRQTDAIEIDSD